MSGNNYSTTELTPAMIQFLSRRPQVKSDSAAARLIAIHKTTVANWKDKSVAFKKAYDAMLARMSSDVSATPQEHDDFIHEQLIPKSLARLDELVSRPIDSKTPSAIVTQIRGAAEPILEGAGILPPASRDSMRIDILVNQFIEQGAEYRPPWAGKTLEAKPA